MTAVKPKMRAPDSPAGPEAGWLKGYAQSISGETIGYHSLYPEATSALIVRATDGTMAMEWETEPVPASFSASQAAFVWMAGSAAQKGAHAFTLSIDGEPAFIFHTARDASEKSWSLPGPQGASLSFRATMVDQFGELFGFMSLRMPRPLLKPGRPLRLKVTSEKGGSPDWHMVFQHDLRDDLRANSEPALTRKNGRRSQLVRLEVSHFAPPARAAISAGESEPVSVEIETGYNAIYLPVPVVSAPADIPVDVRIKGRPPARLSVRLHPVTPRTFTLLPHSHTDIGYSAPQVQVEKAHWKFLEQAIAIARRTDGYPEGARFKWNVEVLWPLESFLRQASPEQREELFDAVRRGWIEIEALLCNALTGICHPEELFELTAFARRLRKDRGLTIESAMITDIPSYTWNLVPALAQGGIRYFSSGPNYMPFLNDGGDRIGGALKAWGDKPFYWVSPSGREKILFWMAGRGYSWFHSLNMGRLDINNGQPLLDYARELEDRGYPYEIVQVRYTIGGDNGPPDPALPDAVRQWNEEFESPRLAIATTSELFRTLEERYGSVLPTAKGDFTPYWEDGAASSARETAMNRASAARLLQAETLWALAAPKAYPVSEFDEAWRQVLLWDEHTWGAADSISNPDGENARVQWEYKKEFAVQADLRSRTLYDAALTRAGDTAAAAGVFTVINTASWPRAGLVRVPGPAAAEGDRVLDQSGRPVPSQRLSDGALVVWAEGVPAFGSRVFRVVKGEPAKPAAPVEVSGLTLRNGRVDIILEPASGSIARYRWAPAGEINLAGRVNGLSLNGYLYVPGRSPLDAVGASGARITIKEPGPLIASLLVSSNAPGCESLTCEYRLAAGSDRLEIIDHLEKKKVRDKEAVHLGFPLAVPGGRLRLDLGWTWIRPEDDQFAGSCRDFFGLHNGADVSNGDFGITWISLDAPLAEVGAMTDETPAAKGARAWRTKVESSQTLFAYVMNNYWHTNYKADQAGPVAFRFALEPHPGSDPAASKRIGMDAERPLCAVPGTAAFIPPLAVRSDAVVAASLRPARDGAGLMVRLFNATDRPAGAVLSVPDGRLVRLSDPDENRGPAVSGPLSFAPWEIVTIRVESPR